MKWNAASFERPQAETKRPAQWPGQFLREAGVLSRLRRRRSANCGSPAFRRRTDRGRLMRPRPFHDGRLLAAQRRHIRQKDALRRAQLDRPSTSAARRAGPRVVLHLLGDDASDLRRSCRIGWGTGRRACGRAGDQSRRQRSLEVGAARITLLLVFLFG